MPNYLDDFICNSTPEDYENQYISDEMWRETLIYFCEEMNIEPEVYED